MEYRPRPIQTVIPPATVACLPVTFSASSVQKVMAIKEDLQEAPAYTHSDQYPLPLGRQNSLV